MKVFQGIEHVIGLRAEPDPVIRPLTWLQCAQVVEYGGPGSNGVGIGFGRQCLVLETSKTTAPTNCAVVIEQLFALVVAEPRTAPPGEDGWQEDAMRT
jgi:hypothetical protein